MSNKLITLAVFVLFFCFSVGADEITPYQLSIKYNEATARVEAFKNIEKKIPKDLFSKYLKDENRKENLIAIEKNRLLVNNERVLCPFYMKQTLISYAITYLDNPDMTYYYNILGFLIKIEKKDNLSQYPKKILGYTRYGNLLSVTFEVDENEHFIYDEGGKLVGHWLDNKLIENGKLNLLKLERGNKNSDKKSE